MSDAEKQKRWLRAIYMNGFAAGHAFCGTTRMGLPDQSALGLAHLDATEAFGCWGLTPSEMRAAQAYVIELHNADAPKGKADAE